MNQPIRRADRSGSAAMIRKAATAARKITAPQIATCSMLPMKPEYALSPASSPRLRNTKPSITTPSKTRSTRMVASEAEIGTAWRRRRT